MWSTRTLSPRQIYGVQAICLGTKTCERPATKPLALKNELCGVIDKTYFLSSSLNQAQTTGNDDNVAAEMVSKQAKNKPIGLFTYHFKATWQVNDILFRVHRLLSWWVTRSLSTFIKIASCYGSIFSHLLLPPLPPHHLEQQSAEQRQQLGCHRRHRRGVVEDFPAHLQEILRGPGMEPLFRALDWLLHAVFSKRDTVKC